MTEMRGFVFAVSFLLISSAILGSAPAGLITPSYDNPSLVGLDPALVTGFSSYTQYTKSNYTLVAGTYIESYLLGGWDWYTVSDNTNYMLGVKQYIWIIWVSTDTCEFTTEKGIPRGTELTFTEITADAENGTVRYSAIHSQGSSSVLFWWNTTDYATAASAWAGDELYITHGVGVNDEAPVQVLSLLLGMLTFSLPDVPFLIQLMLSTPIFASVIYLIWFLVKEVIPFV